MKPVPIKNRLLFMEGVDTHPPIAFIPIILPPRIIMVDLSGHD